MAILIRLKLKYRPGNAILQSDGGYIWKGQRWRPNPGAPGNGRGVTKSKVPPKQQLRPRRRAWGPWGW